MYIPSCVTAVSVVDGSGALIGYVRRVFRPQNRIAKFDFNDWVSNPPLRRIRQAPTQAYNGIAGHAAAGHALPKHGFMSYLSGLQRRAAGEIKISPAGSCCTANVRCCTAIAQIRRKRPRAGHCA
ncbi:hypothetical protein J7355_07975 [Endozoicomonas sp. G2_2]|uniref:hypothetical protein n=1 Tax=Endozoicomonas sp. G2_2 TaxID=2821092 RepID=UPI001ADD258C|nr:hypothetical protein [Endozoicomonas sp. G2_2]MBO9470034.1 hypothetical protein [Endozoicomonas sp. G2_2]